jgi:hypothetical protein
MNVPCLRVKQILAKRQGAGLKLLENLVLTRHEFTPIIPATGEVEIRIVV